MSQLRFHVVHTVFCLCITIAMFSLWRSILGTASAVLYKRIDEQFVGHTSDVINQSQPSFPNETKQATFDISLFVSPPTTTQPPAAEQLQLQRRHKIYADLIGGLGNQLWIWFSSQGIAQKNSAIAAYSYTNIRMLDSVFQLNRSFDFELIDATSENNSLPVLHWWEKGYDSYDSDVEIHGDTQLHTYLQNPKYAANSSDLFAQSVAAKLHFHPTVLQDAKELLHRMGTCSTTNSHGQSQNQAVVKTWVGVHVRRFPDRHTAESLPSSALIVQQIQSVMARHCQTDERRHTNSSNNSTMITCDDKDEANNLRHLAPCCALVFSNDPPWVREQIRPNGQEQQFCIQYVDNEFLQDPEIRPRRIKIKPRRNGWATHFGRDMATLSMCDHLIITVGTYGFFSGLLHQQHNGFSNQSSSTIQRQVYVYAQSHTAQQGFVPTFWEQWPSALDDNHTQDEGI
jgi:hypothetical protein